jgi:hypothetical protein
LKNARLIRVRGRRLLRKEKSTMNSNTKHFRFGCAAFVVAIALSVWASPLQAQVTYSGRAFAAYVNLPTLGLGPKYLSDTGELPSQGGSRSAQLVDAKVPGILGAALLVARTSGANGVARSSASLVEAQLFPGNAAQVTARFVGAESEATCDGVRGSTEVAQVTFGGLALSVDPFTPNQVFTLPDPIGGPPLATLIINEQRRELDAGSRAITVNAVHLTLKSGDEVVLAGTHSDINGCPGCPPPPECEDFVTGGGWIMTGGGRASFGFNAGFKPNASSRDVSFNYIDHNTGMHMKATTITVYAEGRTKTSRHFEGAAEIEGVPGYTYQIDVEDNGEPGRSTDSLTIGLSNGYQAAGHLAGGNIQLHKACP